MSLSEKKKDKMFKDKEKSGSKYEDVRYGGRTVNKVRQQQRRETILGNITKRAKSKKKMGMALFPEEEWVLANPTLFL